MSIIELRKRTKQKLDILQADDVRAAATFVDFLAERSGADAPVAKRLSIAQRLKIGQQEYRTGTGTPINKLKRKS